MWQGVQGRIGKGNSNNNYSSGIQSLEIKLFLLAECGMRTLSRTPIGCRPQMVFCVRSR